MLQGRDRPADVLVLGVDESPVLGQQLLIWQWIQLKSRQNNAFYCAQVGKDVRVEPIYRRPQMQIGCWRGVLQLIFNCVMSTGTFLQDETADASYAMVWWRLGAGGTGKLAKAGQLFFVAGPS